MSLKRRTFLQQISLALAALGMSEAGLTVLTDRSQQALAQSTRRKLALLIGINQYPEQVCDFVPSKGTALNGCLTDVELQQELLIHRFGFQPNDVLTLTDQQATRSNIEAAFQYHLGQAQAGDVVLFHFSGLGSQIKTGETQEVQQSLVPIDGLLPTADRSVIQDIPLETLILLIRSLSTEQIITVLDTSYASSGQLLQGSLRIRSRPNAPSGQVSAAEQKLQADLMQQTGASRAQIRAQWQSGQSPGILLAGAADQQIVTEVQWNGFTAGLFTYALTQQLWASTAATTLYTFLGQTIGKVQQAAGTEQRPILNGQKLPSQTIATVLSPDLPSADGVIRSIEEDGKIQLWLAGLPAIVLENSGASLFAVQSASDSNASLSESLSDRPLLQVRSHDGLVSKAKLLSSGTAAAQTGLQAGQLVQEALRLLPRNINLMVALDASLERIERVDATSAFATIPQVSAVIAGEQPADFLFGKTQPAAATLTASLSPQASTAIDPAIPASNPLPDNSLPANKRSYGLFSLGRDVIPNTLIQADEAVKTAINRMTPQLRSLLATKLVRLLENRGSSRLGVRVTLETIAPQERVILQQETNRAPWNAPPVSNALLTNGIVQLPVSSRVQYRLLNYSDKPIYFIVLGLDTNGNAIVYSPAAISDPANTKPSSETSLIPPGETRLIPPTASENVIQAPAGLAETHLIFSRAPFTQAYTVLDTKVRPEAGARQIIKLRNPLEVVQAVLQDLHQATGQWAIDLPSDAYALDVNQWAGLSFICEVISA
ncbi:MAG TPA: caspase family protein [Trichocoleus sp.]|jgi:hypothetical protein